MWIFKTYYDFEYFYSIQDLVLFIIGFYGRGDFMKLYEFLEIHNNINDENLGVEICKVW